MHQESSFQFLVFNFFILTSGGVLEGLLAVPGQDRHPLLRPLQNPPALPHQGDPAFKDLESLVQGHRLGLETPQDLIQPLQVIAKRHRSFPLPIFRSIPLHAVPHPLSPSRGHRLESMKIPPKFKILLVQIPQAQPRTFFHLKKI